MPERLPHFWKRDKSSEELEEIARALLRSAWDYTRQVANDRDIDTNSLLRLYIAEMGIDLGGIDLTKLLKDREDIITLAVPRRVMTIYAYDKLVKLTYLNPQRVISNPLTPTELSLILILAKMPNRIVPSDDLLSLVWGPHQRGNGRMLRTNVNRLRGKLEDPEGEIIYNRPGIGYGLHGTPVDAAVD